MGVVARGEQANKEARDSTAWQDLEAHSSTTRSIRCSLSSVPLCPCNGATNTPRHPLSGGFDVLSHTTRHLLLSGRVECIITLFTLILLTTELFRLFRPLLCGSKGKPAHKPHAPQPLTYVPTRNRCPHHGFQSREPPTRVLKETEEAPLPAGSPAWRFGRRLALGEAFVRLVGGLERSLKGNAHRSETRHSKSY